MSDDVMKAPEPRTSRRGRRKHMGTIERPVAAPMGRLIGARGGTRTRTPHGEGF
jgi:hypothetical protein